MRLNCSFGMCTWAGIASGNNKRARHNSYNDRAARNRPRTAPSPRLAVAHHVYSPELKLLGWILRNLDQVSIRATVFCLIAENGLTASCAQTGPTLLGLPCWLLGARHHAPSLLINSQLNVFESSYQRVNG